MLFTRVNVFLLDDAFFFFSNPDLSRNSNSWICMCIRLAVWFCGLLRGQFRFHSHSFNHSLDMSEWWSCRYPDYWQLHLKNKLQSVFILCTVYLYCVLCIYTVYWVIKLYLYCVFIPRTVYSYCVLCIYTVYWVITLYLHCVLYLLRGTGTISTCSMCLYIYSSFASVSSDTLDREIIF